MHTLTDEQKDHRSTLVITLFARGQEPEVGCDDCGWVGTDNDTIWESRPTKDHPHAGKALCGACKSPNLADYESNLYKAGYR